MHGSHRFRSAAARTALLLLLACPLRSLPADPASFGELRLGMTAAVLAQRLGPPAGKEEQPSECPGDPPLAVWDYAAQGLMLVVAGTGPTAILLSVSGFGPTPSATERGIAIGSTYAQVRAAYPQAADASRASFRVLLERGALEVSFSNTPPYRVTRILLTAETPRVYEDGEDCGRPVQ